MKFIKFKPANRLLQVAVSLVLLSLFMSFLSDVETIWYLIVITIFSVLLFDLWRVYKVPAPSIMRKLSATLSVGVRHEVKLTVKNISHQQLSLDLYDYFTEQVQVDGMPRRLILEASESAELTYHLKPLHRGILKLTTVECQILSPLNLWYFKHLLDVNNSARVYPDYAPIIEYTLLATENHLSMMGILKHRRRGQGMDFHQLREFRENDSIKQIDWKASSRMRKMIAREYQDERDQQIIFMLDCGHRMLAQDGELSHFDYSLNALLLLSYVALKQGDSIGVSTFSHENSRWIKPVKSILNINSLLNGIYDLQPGSDAPDYSSGARDLILRQRKRSLVIVLTNLRDDDADDLKAAVLLLKKYHKVVVVSLQEQVLVQALDKQIVDLDDALTLASTHSYLLKRNILVNQLRALGIKTLDVLPEQLALAMTNVYLDLKTSGQI